MAACESISTDNLSLLSIEDRFLIVKCSIPCCQDRYRCPVRWAVMKRQRVKGSKGGINSPSFLPDIVETLPLHTSDMEHGAARGGEGLRWAAGDN